MSVMKKQKLNLESEKTKRYDRQLRLWGDHGQASLESAHICLINATATGTEVLKSLVLPGIGAFSILDGNKVTEGDIGNNFFLDQDSIGQPRAKVATELLLELNSEVHGEFVDESVEDILNANPKFFEKFSVVIATNLTEKTLLLLSERLWLSKIPLLVCRAYGMLGYIRLQLLEHTIIESHPENEFYDLRLDKPFEALQEFVNSVDLDSLSNKDHSHTPFVVILLKYLNKWKEQHNGEIPKNSKEKDAFKESIKSGMRQLGGGEKEENFEEAIRAVNRMIVKTIVPQNIKELFDDPSCTELTSESSSFWIIMRALKEFSDKNGCLPLSGPIPDMTADTERYIKLQNIYRTQAEKDISSVNNIVQNILSTVGKPQHHISESKIKLMCRNCHDLRVVRGSSMMDEYKSPSSNMQSLLTDLDHDDSDIIFYVLLRAVDKFYNEYKRYPGEYIEQVEPDIIQLKSCLSSLLQEWGCSPLSKDDYIHEICHLGAAELHSVASFIGGCAAHEVIKLITGQYVPFNNTLIFNGISSTSSVYYF